MLACQIERGFLMYTTGARVDMGLFSRDVVGTIAGEYAYTASLLSKRRWKKITKLCDAYSTEEKTTLKVHAALNRRTLYEPSSPIKESDCDSEWRTQGIYILSLQRSLIMIFSRNLATSNPIFLLTQLLHYHLQWPTISKPVAALQMLQNPHSFSHASALVIWSWQQ